MGFNKSHTIIASKRRKIAAQRLRDELAAVALQGLCAHLTGPKALEGESAAAAHGRTAYLYADAAMKARAA